MKHIGCKHIGLSSSADSPSQSADDIRFITAEDGSIIAVEDGTLLVY